MQGCGVGLTDSVKYLVRKVLVYKLNMLGLLLHLSDPSIVLIRKINTVVVEVRPLHIVGPGFKSRSAILIVHKPECCFKNWPQPLPCTYSLQFTSHRHSTSFHSTLCHLPDKAFVNKSTVTTVCIAFTNISAIK